MNNRISEILNNAFEKLHPQFKVTFTEVESGKYKFETQLYDKQGKFRRGSSGEQVFSSIKDERFSEMIRGSAKGLSAILTNEEDIISFIEGPNTLIIEYVLTNNSLSTIHDFAAELDSISKREQLMIKEYFFKETEIIGVEIEDFSKNEEAFSTLGSFQLCFSSPPIKELGVAIGKLVHNKKNWSLLSHWIKEWLGASQWSMNEAWEGGPLIEELLAYGTFKMMEKEVDTNNKPEWWSDLYIMIDICLDFTPEDLNKCQFIIE